MNTITIKKIHSGNYVALRDCKLIASITRSNKRSWVVVNRIGHVRVFRTLSASKCYLESGDLF